MPKPTRSSHPLNSYLGFGSFAGVNDPNALVRLYIPTQVIEDSLRSQYIHDTFTKYDELAAVPRPNYHVNPPPRGHGILSQTGFQSVRFRHQHHFYRSASKAAVHSATHLMDSEATTPSPTTPGQQ